MDPADPIAPMPEPELPKGVPAGLVPPGGAAVLLRIVSEHGLHKAWAGQVVRLGEDRKDGWRVCCAGSCEVCVETLGRAVDAWRGWLDQHRAD